MVANEFGNEFENEFENEFADVTADVRRLLDDANYTIDRAKFFFRAMLFGILF